MGKMITSILSESPQHSIAALLEAPGHPDVGIEVETGNSKVVVIATPGDMPAAVDIGLDFSAAGGGREFARAIAARNAALLVGTTGLPAGEIDHLKDLSARIPVLVASNTSVGVFCLTELAVAARKILGDDYDVEILEVHHRHKKDAPSGTAISIADALRRTGLEPAVGRTGQRGDDEIGIASARGGEVVGTHTVYFLGRHDQIEICHRAASREGLAEGAVRLGESLKQLAPGWYAVADLLRR